MRCDNVVINLPDYILDKVEPNLRKCIGAHLAICGKCKSEFDEIRESIMVLDKVAQEEYPEAFWQELRAIIMGKISSLRPARWRVPVFAGGLAALLLVVGIGIYEYVLKPVSTIDGQAETVTALASSLPAYEVAELPNLNINYVNAAAPQIVEADEMNAIDDSTQQAVVKSMWTASVTDSASAIDYFDYPENIISN
ncbi:MAG: hypothetical protein WAO19_02615 [Candidatus Kryptoniota bacterium]